MAAIGGELICQKDAFLCAALGTEVSIAFSKKIGAGFFGGEGFILQRLRGDGMAFVHAGGTGKVMLQSLPFSRMADRIIAASRTTGGKGEGSVLGGLGNLLDGD
jgi:uncharacterized protein (AIM24 family)